MRVFEINCKQNTGLTILVIANCLCGWLLDMHNMGMPEFLGGNRILCFNNGILWEFKCHIDILYDSRNYP